MAPLAGTVSRRGRQRRPSVELERFVERTLEDGDTGPGALDSGGLGRSALSHDRRSNRQHVRRERRVRRPRRGWIGGRGGASARSPRDRSHERQDRLAADRDRVAPARGISPFIWKLCVERSRNRRPACLCVLRVAGTVCVRPERKATVAEGLRPEDGDAAGLRRRQRNSRAQRTRVSPVPTT
jgi:hypothetical protein